MTGREQRSENRVKVSWPARAGRKEQGVFSAQILNASIRGMYFESTHNFPEKSRIFLEIKASHGDQEQNLLVEGEVVRVTPTSTSALLGHGVQIRRIRDDDLFFLLAVIADLWQNQQPS